MPKLVRTVSIAMLLLQQLAAGAADSGFQWTCTKPLVGPEVGRDDRCVSVKDPSIVRYNGKWHLFCTIRSAKRSHQIEYLNFDRWEQANDAPRHILKLTSGYFCAPQVFYFSPQSKWYLIYQISMPDRPVQLQPAWSASTNIFDPLSWSAPEPLFSTHPPAIKQWIDFWAICDSIEAHLFFTSFDGKLWRSDTPLESFPHGWSEPRVALQADIFEANHTYALGDRGGYLSLIEAQGPGNRRYYKAFRADSLRGIWQPLADSFEHPFASLENVHFSGLPWTDSFSHGELLRTGFDEKLEVNWSDLTFLFQGVTDQQRQGRSYGDIPWRLGLLKQLRR